MTSHIAAIQRDVTHDAITTSTQVRIESTRSWARTCSCVGISVLCNETLLQLDTLLCCEHTNVQAFQTKPVFLHEREETVWEQAFELDPHALGCVPHVRDTVVRAEQSLSTAENNVNEEDIFLHKYVRQAAPVYCNRTQCEMLDKRVELWCGCRDPANTGSTFTCDGAAGARCIDCHDVDGRGALLKLAKHCCEVSV